MCCKTMSRLPQMQSRRNPDEILKEKAGFEDDLRIDCDDSEGTQSISVETMP